MASSASQRRAALATTTSSTGWTSVGEPLMTRKTSAVAVCALAPRRLALCTRKLLFKVCIGDLRHRGLPCPAFGRRPSMAVRLLTRLVEVRLKAYARLGNGSMALGRAVCTGDTINCCDAHLTSAMGQNPNASRTLPCQLSPAADMPSHTLLTAMCQEETCARAAICSDNRAP